MNFRILPGDTVEDVIRHTRETIDDERIAIISLLVPYILVGNALFIRASARDFASLRPLALCSPEAFDELAHSVTHAPRVGASFAA